MAKILPRQPKQRRPKPCACKQNKGNKKCWCEKKTTIACFCQDKFGRMSKRCECHKKKKKSNLNAQAREKVCACKPKEMKRDDCYCPDQPEDRKDCLCDDGRDPKGRKGNKCFCGEKTGTKTCFCKHKQAEQCLVQ